MQAQFYFLNVNGSSRVKPPPLTFTLEILAATELPIEVIIKCLALATISIPTAMLIPVLFHIHCACAGECTSTRRRLAAVLNSPSTVALLNMSSSENRVPSMPQTGFHD